MGNGGRGVPHHTRRNVVAAQHNGRRPAVPFVQNLLDLRKHFDDDFKSIGDFIKAADVRIE
jgi:hypothetical protein